MTLDSNWKKKYIEKIESIDDESDKDYSLLKKNYMDLGIMLSREYSFNKRDEFEIKYIFRSSLGNKIENITIKNFLNDYIRDRHLVVMDGKVLYDGYNAKFAQSYLSFFIKAALDCGHKHIIGMKIDDFAREFLLTLFKRNMTYYREERPVHLMKISQLETNNLSRSVYVMCLHKIVFDVISNEKIVVTLDEKKCYSGNSQSQALDSLCNNLIFFFSK